MTSFSLLAVVIFLTLAFEFSNGWHDAANSIATVVSTRVLTPFRAVAWAAFWNFIAAFVFGTAVAKAIGKGSKSSFMLVFDSTHRIGLPNDRASLINYNIAV